MINDMMREAREEALREAQEEVKKRYNDILLMVAEGKTDEEIRKVYSDYTIEDAKEMRQIAERLKNK